LLATLFKAKCIDPYDNGTRSIHQEADNHKKIIMGDKKKTTDEAVRADKNRAEKTVKHEHEKLSSGKKNRDNENDDDEEEPTNNPSMTNSNKLNTLDDDEEEDSKCCGCKGFL
jgi:hypothetical protein